MKLAAALAALIMAALVLPFVLPRAKAPTDQRYLPWQVEVLEDGRSRVFGLMLPTSTLADARRLHGGDLTLGLMREAGGELSLEAYQPSAQLGFVTGKLILTLAVSIDDLTAMASRAADSEATRSGARRLSLATADVRSAEHLRIAGISFVPSVDLDRQMIVDRFGEPEQRIEQPGGLVHYLYPSRGLDLLIDDGGREVLQYVAPADFTRLTTPLAVGNGREPSAQ